MKKNYITPEADILPLQVGSGFMIQVSPGAEIASVEEDEWTY